MDFGDLPSKPLRKRKPQTQSSQGEAIDHDKMTTPVITGPRPPSRFRPIIDDRIASVLDVNIGIHLSGQDTPRFPAPRLWLGRSCRSICWCIFVMCLAAASIVWNLAGRFMSNISIDRTTNMENAAIASELPLYVSNAVQSEHSALVDSLVDQKQRRMKQSIDLAIAFADQARALDSQRQAGNDPGLDRTIDSLPEGSDTIMSTINDRVRDLSYEIQDVIDALDHVKMTAADAHVRMHKIEQELPSTRTSFIYKWWQRSTRVHAVLRTHIDAILSLDSVISPLIQSTEGKVGEILNKLNTFREDVGSLCSGYDNLEAYITLQARLLSDSVSDSTAMRSPVNLGAHVPTDDSIAQLEGVCQVPHPNTDAVMFAGDSMAAMSAFCGEVSHGFAETLVLGDGSNSGRKDVMGDQELLVMLTRKVGKAVWEHEELMTRARHISELL